MFSWHFLEMSEAPPQQLEEKVAVKVAAFWYWQMRLEPGD